MKKIRHFGCVLIVFALGACERNDPTSATPERLPELIDWNDEIIDRKLAVVANRTRKRTKSFGRLMRFLDSLGIPIIAVLRDSQNFVHAAEQGIGIHEMQPSRVAPDVEQIDRIVQWLDGWQERRKRAIQLAQMSDRSATTGSTISKPQFGSA